MKSQMLQLTLLFALLPCVDPLSTMTVHVRLEIVGQDEVARVVLLTIDCVNVPLAEQLHRSNDLFSVSLLDLSDGVGLLGLFDKAHTVFKLFLNCTINLGSHDNQLTALGATTKVVHPGGR